MAKLQKKSIADQEELREILRRYWGYSHFRPLQEEIIQSVLWKGDTLALMPTGGGKSLTFQVPAMATGGICLVVTPLIALMKDQVDQLIGRKIKAVAIHSGMNRQEIDVTLNNCIFGGVKFLYVSPERLGTELFRIRAADMPVNLIAVDEAHCISQWGYDFRPSYLEIHRLRELLPDVPVLALTATATPEVCDDIQEKLGFSAKNVKRMSFDRENLAYLVRATEDKSRELQELLHELEGSGIVYTRSRRKCRDLALLLKESGVTAAYYHAGLSQAERDTRQQQWMENRFRVMVATNAFGMGIDKPDVRFVVHVDLPDAPEAYFQEAGRAGRDGLESKAILLFSQADKRVAGQRIEVNFPGIPRVRKVYSALCNFLQIPTGSGRGHSYDFDFGTFLQRYKLSATVTHSALQILEREGYIVLTDAFHNPSRLKFLVERDALYQFQLRHAELDEFIKLLLRSFSGLFTQYVKIDESLLSRRTGLPKDRIFLYLRSLSVRQIIHYIPRKEVPVITFLEERLDDRNLLISTRKYQFRKERYVHRIGEMLRYASSDAFCRNQFLLSYFGQTDTPRCGRCDVCLPDYRPEPGSDEFRRIAREIQKLTMEETPGLEQLIRVVGYQRGKVTGVLEWLVDQGVLTRDEQLKFRWRGSPSPFDSF